MKPNFITRYFRRHKLKQIKKEINNPDIFFEYNSTQDKYYFIFENLYRDESKHINYPYLKYDACRHKKSLIKYINNNLAGTLS